MKWIKITDDNGQVIKDRLPEKDCYINLAEADSESSRCDCQWWKPEWNTENYRLILKNQGWTHYQIVSLPSEPQPEDVLVDALKEIATKCSGDCPEGLHPAHDCHLCPSRKATKALAEWEAK